MRIPKSFFVVAGIVIILFLMDLTTPPANSQPQDMPLASVGTPTLTDVVAIHITLPEQMFVGQQVTMTVRYENLGAPYTSAALSPTGILIFDPPRTWPCKWNEDANYCTQFGMKAVQAGMVLVTVGASGEACFPSPPGCWYAHPWTQKMVIVRENQPVYAPLTLR